MATSPAGTDLASAPVRNDGTSAQNNGDHPPVRSTGRAVAVSIHLIAIISVAGALFFAKAFLLPIVLAIISSLILIPIVRWFSRRGVPPALTASALVLTGVLFFVIGVLALSPAVVDWINQAPLIAAEVEWKLRDLRGSVEAVTEAGKQVEELTSAEEDPLVQEVVVREPGFLTTATFTVWTVLSTIVITALLSVFLLGSGDMFYIKLIRLMPTLSDKKTALRIMQSVERSISRYLLTVTIINAGLGVCVGVAMWLLGMPNPALWGVAAALLNFLPYVGAIAGVVIVSAVSFVTFDTVAQAAIVPLVYISLTSLEGQIVTPLVVGRRLEINTVAIFIGIAFWGWLWGLVGILLAVPILVIVKQIAEHLPSWHATSEFLSSGAPRDDEDEDDEPKRAT
ncbi:MAG TPA: AI-2E family transporter [Saliniramus sp.]|nr:AI-2E family transporter [Saliniramus sp.]